MPCAWRLRVSLTRMRQLGLREILQTREDGHLLDADVPIRFADSA